MIPEILYEDNHILVAVKPPDLPVQADSSGDMDMLTVLKNYIKEKYNKPGNVYLGLVHRLDRPVGGVMVFARTSKAASRLTDSFKKLSTHKKYVAVVSGHTPFEKSLEGYMKKDEKTFSSFMCDKNTEGAKFAALDFKRLAFCDKKKLSLVDVTLKTGRHHQIRLQLSNEGHAIYGDHRYNSAFINDNKTHIALFAYSLTLEHPITHEIMRFSAVPKGSVWDCFSEHLSCLKADAVPVYIDENIIVCDKMRGQSVAISDGDQNTLEEKLNTALNKVFPVHRLDATTEGLIVFGRNATACDALLKAFSDKTSGQIEKFYRCTVIGKPKKTEQALNAYLLKDGQTGTVKVTQNQINGSKQIETHYKLLNTYQSEGNTLSELEIKLITGRTHQIRAHMAFAGLPLLGDDKYGNREVNKKLHTKKIYLRSCRIKFNFPENNPLYYLNSIKIGE